MTKILGNCLVAQSGGPTTVINASLYGVVINAVKSNSINEVYGGINGIEGIINEDLINFKRIPYEKLKRSEYSPSVALGSCRFRLKNYEDDDSDYKKIFNNFKKYNIRYFFYIGGNDSMDTADKINRYANKIGYDIKIIGIPKTIDNDLMYTDHCPGYGSAAKFIAMSTLELALDAEAYSLPTINILEVMGRNTGWLAASAALAKRKMPLLKLLVYIPEMAFSIEKFIEDVTMAQKESKNVFISVSEGVVDKKGNYISCLDGLQKRDSFGHIQLGGIGESLATIVRENVFDRVKLTRLGVLQRCAMHCASLRDFKEAELLGEAAVKYALNGISGKMLCLKRKKSINYDVYIDTIDLNKVSNKEKKMNSEMFNSDYNGITDIFDNYALPLIQGEVRFSMSDGLPSYTNFKYAV